MKSGKRGSVRIIGGRWRGTRLPVPDLPGLRPTGDRGREVLFNWLQAELPGSRCADLFAGSGALGLEAASRGASRVLLLDNSPVAVHTIRESLKRLGASESVCRQVEVLQTDALDWLQNCEAETLDIVFVDPPFDSGLAIRSLELLADSACMKRGGLVYVETERKSSNSAPGPAWEIDREKVLGDVRMMLLKKI